MNQKKMEDYLSSLNKPLEDLEWEKLYQTSVRKKIPVVRKNTAKLLYMLTKTQQPLHALEIGTGSGYSTLWIEKGLPENGSLITLERDLNRFNEAQRLFEGHHKINLLYQDAFQYLAGTDGFFDFVFLDSQKRDYIDFLKILEKRITSGGLLVTDNFLFGGKVIAMTPDEKDKYGNGVRLLKEFNKTLSSHPQFETIFLPLEDGVCLARKL